MADPKKVPLVTYGTDGTRKVIGTAHIVETPKTGIYGQINVACEITDEEFVSKLQGDMLTHLSISTAINRSDVPLSNRYKEGGS